MGDRTSEDKVCRRIVYVLVKLSDVSGPDLGEAGRYNLFSASSL